MYMFSAIFLAANFLGMFGLDMDVIPILSYSSTSGFVGGVMLKHSATEYFKIGYSLTGFYGTKGSGAVDFSLYMPVPSGEWRLNAGHSKLKNHKFFGWGNGGNADSLAEYVFETQRIELSRSFFLSSRMMLTTSIKARHSTTYDRDTSPLWEESPSERYGSVWSAGPHFRSRVNYSLPFFCMGYTELSGDYQFGSDFSYGSIRSDMAVFKEIPGFILPGTVIGIHGRLNRYFNVSEIPFPMLPSLGGADDLRGFSNFRFRGPWSLLCNLEIRQPVFSLQDENITKGGNPSLTIILALFADMGQVAEEFSGFCGDRFHSDAGFGLRIYMGEAVLRADMAFSDEGNKFHMCFNELF